ncbi:MAG: lysophospholipid acyltransferase family protein [Deltaproteobacteria bacterium]|nr:lysophospholipid acyltransferase family protein [Deltaproteobacteria bacterium]
MHLTIFDIPVLRDIMRGLALLILKICGWRREGKLPDIPKYIMIAAPHTSNWDLLFTMAVALAFRLKICWMGKHTLFRRPFGPLLCLLGGIPIDRTKSRDTVAQIVQAFRERARMVMIISPEGTRKKVKVWKTGFYHIARGADVPVLLAFLDYMKKVGGFGPLIYLSESLEADMAVIRSFYATVTPRHPEKTCLAAVVSVN